MLPGQTPKGKSFFCPAIPSHLGGLAQGFLNIKKFPRVAGAARNSRWGALMVGGEGCYRNQCCLTGPSRPFSHPLAKGMLFSAFPGTSGWVERVEREGLETDRLQEPRGKDQVPLSYELDKSTFGGQCW